MGGATSRFSETAWDQVDGGVRDASETLDGNAPTEAHTILTLKRPILVNQRLFQVLDDCDQVVYQSTPVEGTTKDFDLSLGQQDEEKNEKKLFRIHATDASHSKWMIFSYGKPAFDEQVADHTLAASNNAEAGELNDGDALYRVARVDIAYDKHAGHVQKYVPGTDDNRGVLEPLEGDDLEPKYLLKVEEIKSHTAQYQSYVPSATPSPNLDAVVHPLLVGFWVWEHSPNRHQIKMHLARHTDMALHCLLAIITNQVYVENQTKTED